MTRYISTTDTAKLVRAALKQAWPTVKFSVRSSSYSGGSSIDVSWTDGPTSRQVDEILHRYEGASFDGMIDLKSYHDSVLNGERVKFGADFVHGQRDISPDLMRMMADFVGKNYAVDHVPALVENRWKWKGQEHVSYHFEDDWDNRFGNQTVKDFIMQQCYAYDCTTGLIYDPAGGGFEPLDLDERFRLHEARYAQFVRSQKPRVRYDWHTGSVA